MVSNACSCTKFFNNFKFIECVIFDASLTLHFLAAKLLYSTLCVSLSVNPLFYFYPINKCYKVNRENGVKNVKNLKGNFSTTLVYLKIVLSFNYQSTKKWVMLACSE